MNPQILNMLLIFLRFRSSYSRVRRHKIKVSFRHSHGLGIPSY